MLSRPSCPTSRERFAALCGVLLLTACQADDSGSVDNVADTHLSQRVTVSGISAGGYMAVQAHLALADRIGGAAVIAAGPYQCAQGSLQTALSSCLQGGDLDVQALTAIARERAGAGQLAPVELLGDDRVWLFHGTRDTVVGAQKVAALGDFYSAFVPAENLVSVTNIPAGHGWPTDATGGVCAEEGGDYLNACGFDAAGALLTHLYGELAAPGENGPLETIDVAAHAVPGSDVADEALVYVPPNCRAATADCRLHIAFHGCRQGAAFVEDRFARGNGLNAWATNNDIVVVYPEVEKSLTNPQGCWDWWGYTGKDYDVRAGKQIRTVAALIDAWCDESGCRLER